MAERRIFNLYGGVDSRDTFEVKSDVVYLESSKNIEVDGKRLRRMKGQELITTITGTPSILGMHQHEVEGEFYLRLIADDGKYYTVDTGAGEEIARSSWDISSGSYDSKSITTGSPTSGEGNPTTFTIGDSGTKLYILGSSQDTVYQSTLSTAWDISTAGAYDKTFALTTRDENYGLTFKPDGTKMYAMNRAGGDDKIHQYSLSTAWDVSTATYDSKSLNVNSEESAVNCLRFSSDGTKAYVLGIGTETIYQYTLTTAWDVSTGSYSSKSFLANVQDTNPYAFFFNSNGTKFYLTGATNNRIYQYALSTAWDVSTAAYESVNLNVSLETATPYDLYIKPDGTKLYVLGSTDDEIYQYSFGGTEAKTGLSGSSPYFFQFKNKLVCITGGDDPFTDDGTIIEQTTFYDEHNVYGTCGAAFHGRIFIGDGNSIYWSAANTTDDWTTADDAGSKSDLIGKVVDMEVYGSYLFIFTTAQIYYLSGFDDSDFSFNVYSDIGVFSKFIATKLYDKVYFWKDGLYPLEVSGDMAQARIKTPISHKINNSITDIDQSRLDEIITVAYTNRNQVWTYVPINDDATLYKCWIANLENFNDTKVISFYVREGNAITCAAEYKGNIYTGTSGGKIYKEDSTDDFDGTGIDANAWFRTLSFNSSQIKNCDEMLFWFDTESTNDCVIKFKYNGLSEADEETIIISDSDLGSADKVSELVPIRDEWRSIQIGIDVSSTGQDFILYGFSFMNLRLTNEY